MRKLQPHEVYVCLNGCGECDAQVGHSVYFREVHPDGSDITLSELAVMSSCCGGGVEIWDKRAQRMLDEVVEP